MYYKVFAIILLFAIVEGGRTRIRRDAPVEIRSQDSQVESDGSYEFSFESADGIYREEKGVVMNPGTDDEYIHVTGKYKYITYQDSNRKDWIEVSYTADKDGFVPVLGEGSIQ